MSDVEILDLYWAKIRAQSALQKRNMALIVIAWRWASAVMPPWPLKLF